MMRSYFNGFVPETFGFFRGIKENNNHEWFEAHRDEYKKYVQTPMKELSIELTDGMLSIDEQFITGGRTVSRIRRDTRFSNDKTPYKSVSWLVFKRPSADWCDAPAYFIEIGAERYVWGMGFYSAKPATMRRFREMIDTDTKQFADAVSFYSSGSGQPFILGGDEYKRMPAGAGSDRFAGWYRKKNLYLAAERENDKSLYGNGFAGMLLEGFFSLAPLYRFLLEASREPVA
jgi:uncharacterized protein (TIGR02453 family)